MRPTCHAAATVLILATSVAAAVPAQVDGARIARLLADDQPVFGVFSGPQTPEQGAALAAERNTDFVFYSLESGPFDIPTMQAFMGGLHEASSNAAIDAHPFVLRVPPVHADPGAATAHVKEALAAGVNAIVFPHVQTAEEAAAAVETMAHTGDVWPANPDGALVNMLIVEDQEGVANAQAIAATPGVSVVFAGPGDLRRAYQRDMEAVEGAIQTVLAACKSAAVPCGITAGVDDIGTRLAQGFSVIIVTDNAALERGRTLRERSQRATADRDRFLAMPRPIAPIDSIWIEELTTHEVHDAIAAGRTTAIIGAGGIEQNGPYVPTGKHNYILEGTCEAIARDLGDALCAPIMKLVPEGGIDPPSGHMLFPGTISVREETYRMMLTDVAMSLRAGGFTNIVMIGDSGGNQRGMAAVAEELNARWGHRVVHHIPEYYALQPMLDFLDREFDIREGDSEGYHDFYFVNALLMAVDPLTVRYEQRVESGTASINGVDITPLDRHAEIGRRLIEFRAQQTVAAIRTALAGAATDNR